MIDLQKLNDHSRQFANRLFRRWPQWVQYARFDPYEDFEKEALLVEVPRAVDGSSHGLFITTSEWEISIGFGENFHTRFGVSGDTVKHDFYDEAMNFLVDFVEERLVIATAQEGKEWLGAWKVDLRQEKLQDIEVEEGTIIKIRSWLGTHDKNLKPTGI